MPELPEIEALAHGLTTQTHGRVIESLNLRSFAALKTFDPPLDTLRGRRVDRWCRRGKFLLLATDGPWLVVHLARAGWIRWRGAAGTAAPRPGRGPVALEVRFDSGAGLDVTEQGTEKRLAVYAATDPADIPGVARLGVDPLDADLDDGAFFERLHAQPGMLKSVLTDQTVFAGIGNAYSDEILHAAGLSPYRRAAALTADDAAALRGVMTRILLQAVLRAADLPAADLKADKRSGMSVHGRTGLPCPVCGDTVREVSLATRSFQYCPTCQTGGRPLSDRRMSRLLK